MKKKKFDLTTDMVSIEYSDAAKTSHDVAQENYAQRKPQKTKLTLSVQTDFVKEFKSWCVKHDTTMSDSLVQAFPLLKKKYET